MTGPPDYMTNFHLTPREREVSRLLLAGLPNKNIGRLLHIGEQTVANHVTHIIAKTRTMNRTQAAFRLAGYP